MALQREPVRPKSTVERRPPVAAKAQSSATVTGASPARALQQRLGNQGFQTLAARAPTAQTPKDKTPSKVPVVAKQSSAPPGAAASSAPRPPAAASAIPPAAPPPATAVGGAKAPAAPVGEKPPASRSTPSPRAAVGPAIAAVQQRATGARKHAPAGARVASAQAAAISPRVEQNRAAANQTLAKLDAAKTEEVRRNEFKTKLREAIDKATPQPKTESDAERVMKTGGAEASGALRGQLSTQRDVAAGPLKSASTEVSAASQPAPPTATMESEQVGPPPAPVSAAPVVPAPLPPDRLDYSADRGPTEQVMAENNVTPNQMQEANDPAFAPTISARSSAEKHEAGAAAKYQQGEGKVQDQTLTVATQTLAKDLAGIHGIRQQQVGKVGAQQQGAKEKDAQERQRVTETISGIKDKTRSGIEALLKTMEDEAGKIFEAGLARAEKAYNEAFDEAKGGVGTWLTTWGSDWDRHIEQSLATARQRYMREVDAAIDEVATFVEGKIKAAKQLVADGRKEMETFVGGLDASLKQFGEDAVTAVSADFDTMASDIDQRRDGLIDKLTEQYKASYARMSAMEDKLREENKSLWQRVYDATVGLIKKIIAFKDMLLSVLAKAASVIGDIIAHPIRFLGNLVSGVMLGLKNFMSKIGTYLLKGIMDWLFGALAGAGLKLPDKFDLQGIVSIVLQILGLTYANFRSRAVAIVGEPVVKAIETTAEVFKVIVTEGVPGLWRFIKDQLANLKSMVLDAIFDYIKDKVIIAGATWIIGLLNPASAFFKACKAIYDIVMFFINRGSQILALVNAVLDSMAAIASGSIGVAASLVENALAKAIPVAIGFLASLLGLGDPSKPVRGFIEKARAPVNKAIDWVINLAVKGVKSLAALGKTGVRAIVGWWKARTSFKAGGETHSLSFRGEGAQATLILASEPLPVEVFLEEKAADAKGDAAKQKAIKAVRTLLAKIDKLVSKASSGKTEDALHKEIEGLMNEMGSHLVALLSDKEWGTQDNPAAFNYPKRRADAYPSFYLATGSLKALNQVQMQKNYDSTKGKKKGDQIVRYRPTEMAATPDNSATLGLGDGSQVEVGRKLYFEGKERRGNGVKLFKDLVKKFGFIASEYGWDVDHVVELQIGGKDELSNLWPLPKGENRSSGATIKNANIRVGPTEKEMQVKIGLEVKKESNKRKKAEDGLWLIITGTRQM